MELYYSDLSRRTIFLDNTDPNVLIALRPTGGWGHFFQTIQKSTDAGKTWQVFTNGIDTTIGPMQAWINPYSSNVILANQDISFGGDVVFGQLFYRSSDSGLTWNTMSLDSHFVFQKFVFDPVNEATIYAKEYEKPWIKTTDEGNSWAEIGTNLPDSNSRSLFISPYNSNVLYLAVSTELPYEDSKIYRSMNGGIEWTLYSSISPSQYISSILIDPFNHNELNVNSYPYGIFRSSNSGQDWISKSKGLTQSDVCSFSLANLEIIYSGIANRGLFRTTDGGKIWKVINKNLSSCPGKILVSKNNSLMVFSNDYINGLRFSISHDGGDTWDSYPCNYNGLNIFDVASDNQTVYGDAFIGNANGLPISSIIKSTDGGMDWESLNLNIDDINYIDKIEVDPFNKKIVFAIIAIRGAINRNSLIRTTNGGENWTIIADTAANFFINNEDSKYLYRCYGKSIFISENRGETFSNIFINYELKEIVANKLKNGELYGITYSGSIIKSKDHGYNWNIVDELQKDVGIQDLQITYSDSDKVILYGSTWYNGILKFKLNGPTISVESKQFMNYNFRLSHNYPNPFNPTTIIRYRIPETELVTLKVYDVLGREVATLVNEEKSAGKYEIEFNASNLTSGIYFYTIKSGYFYQVKKMILLR